MAMELESNVFDVWVFRRTPTKVEYLLLHTSQYKADRYFNGGRFWQIPSGFMQDSERVVPAIKRLLAVSGLEPTGIWAAEHVYSIYNRRFETMQMIAVYAAEVCAGEVRLDPAEHAESRWCSFDEALELVNYRGLKDGLRSAREYVTGPDTPALELRLL
jgi:NADH pyrophosphatase NudC (nudix superfamily)